MKDTSANENGDWELKGSKRSDKEIRRRDRECTGRKQPLNLVYRETRTE